MTSLLANWQLLLFCSGHRGDFVLEEVLKWVISFRGVGILPVGSCRVDQCRWNDRQMGVDNNNNVISVCFIS